jgi:hypothetical protein
MLRRLGKRGLEDKIPFIIWEVLVILMVVIALTVAVRSIANNTTYWKKYHSADLALMTDLIITNQGDFNVNYNLKAMQTNTVTKALRIDPLVFQIFLRNDAYFVYDKSIDEDRFPQSYIFARDPSRVNIITSNSTNSYLTLRKQGNTFSMGDYYSPSGISCPSEGTTASTKDKHFEALSLADNAKSYTDFVNKLLGKYGNKEQEMLIFLIENDVQSTSVYYDTNIPNPVKSEKMTCLIKKQILQKYPDMNILEKAYDNSFDKNIIFTNNKDNQNNPYNYWIIVQVKKGEITDKELAEFITQAIDEYYK